MVQNSRPRRKCIVFECWIIAFSSISVLFSGHGSRVGYRKALQSLKIVDSMENSTPEQENDCSKSSYQGSCIGCIRMETRFKHGSPQARTKENHRLPKWGGFRT